MIWRATACLLRDWLEYFDAKSCAFCGSSANLGEDSRRQAFNTVIWTYCGLTANPGRRNVDNYCHNRLKSLVGVRRFELPAPASRRQLGDYKQLFLITMLETPADTNA